MSKKGTYVMCYWKTYLGEIFKVLYLESPEIDFAISFLPAEF